MGVGACGLGVGEREYLKIKINIFFSRILIFFLKKNQSSREFGRACARHRARPQEPDSRQHADSGQHSVNTHTHTNNIFL